MSPVNHRELHQVCTEKRKLMTDSTNDNSAGISANEQTLKEVTRSNPVQGR